MLMNDFIIEQMNGLLNGRFYHIYACMLQGLEFFIRYVALCVDWIQLETSN